MKRFGITRIDKFEVPSYSLSSRVMLQRGALLKEKETFTVSLQTTGVFPVV